MAIITIEIPMPDVDELQRELANARRVIATLKDHEAKLQHEIIALNEGRITAGYNTFTSASYYALRARFKALQREHIACLARREKPNTVEES